MPLLVNSGITPAPSGGSGTSVVDWLGAVADVITVLAVLIGGAFAYFKFAKGRLFRPRLGLNVASEVVNVEGQLGLNISVAIHNAGQSALMFDDEYLQQLIVVALEPERWRESREGVVPVEWVKYRWLYEQDLLADEGVAFPLVQYKHPTKQPTHPRVGGWRLEAGEEIRRCILVPVPNDHECFLVIVRVNACAHYGKRMHRSRHRLCQTGEHAPGWWQTDQVVHIGGSDGVQRTFIPHAG